VQAADSASPVAFSFFLIGSAAIVARSRLERRQHQNSTNTVSFTSRLGLPGAPPRVRHCNSANRSRSSISKPRNNVEMRGGGGLMMVVDAPPGKNARE